MWILFLDMKKLDIIIPVLNEADNLQPLVTQIDKVLGAKKISYRLIIVDDHSSDGTSELIKKLSIKYPIIFKLKEGSRGKAYSILEGVSFAESEFVAMIDGDLQYSPSYIPELYEKAVSENLGVVVANRVKHKEGMLRKIGSKVVKFIACSLMGQSVDFQSGLKIFKREVVNHLDKSNIKPWAFDIPLIHTALELGEKIGTVDITFEPRLHGKSKFNFMTSLVGVTEVMVGLLKLKLKPTRVFHLKPTENLTMKGAGIVYKRNKFLTHTTLNHNNSAIVTFTRGQISVIFMILSAFGVGLILSTQTTLIVFVAILSFVYFADVFFNLYLVLKSLHFPPELMFEDNDLVNIKESSLPLYTILCPLYHESGILPQFVDSINKMDYPKNKLEVLLLLEEDDTKTIESARSLKLQKHFKIIVVPHSLPKTKPKACNYGLAHAKGEFVVIYDAEDIPDPFQLKKAVLGFNKLGKSYSCLQAKLNYHNPNQNLLTRLFTSEYSLWFDIMLPALQTINTTIPLGGTSNHFRREDLNKFEGWDPFNVTEDADLGIRLFKAGGKTAIIDSVTLEEANSNLKNWIRQRSRWIKGYMQTYFVHMRNPWQFAKDHGRHWLVFQLVSGLRISFMLINPILWGLTFSYFLLYKFVGPQIESLYPSAVFYMAITSAVFGNFLYIYYYMIGTAKHGQYQLIKYVFLIPIYWVFTSIAATVAFWQLLVKPHYWEKTIHGLTKEEKKKILFKFEFAGLKEFGFSSFNKIKSFSKSSLASGAFLIFASMFANVMNFLYNAYLGRKLDLDDFGLISLVGSFIFLSQVPLSALSRTVTHRSAFLFGRYGTAVTNFWKNTRSKSVKISFLFTAVWILLTPYLMNLFKTDQFLPFLIFAPTWIIGFAEAVDGGFIKGNLNFYVSGVTVITEAVTKLLLAILIVTLGFDHWVYLSIPLSMFSAFLISWHFARKIKQNVEVEIEVENYFPRAFYSTSILTKISSIAFLSLDLILAKIYLSPTDAGLYSLLSLAGKMVYMFGTQFSQFILPIVSKNEGEGRDSLKSFYKLFLMTTVISLLGFLVIGIFGYVTVPLLFGNRVLPIVTYLPYFAFAMAIQVLSQAIVNYYQSKNNQIFPVVNFVVSFFTIFSVIFIHNSITSIVNIMFISSLVSFTVMLVMHIFVKQINILKSNLLDLSGVFKKLPLTNINVDSNLNILIFNWRDTKHVWAGGAEVYVHEIAKRWVKAGHLVTVFCGNDRKSPRNEVIDGVQMVRRGGFYTVYFWAFLYYILRFRGKYDVVIDNENGIPFFAPLYVKEPVIGLVHHVHQEVILKKLKLPKYLIPVGLIAVFIERYLMPIIYKNTQMITVSESSKIDMEKIGLGKIKPILIVNPGVDLSLVKRFKKTTAPSLLFVGRIKAYKSIDTLIKVVFVIKNDIPNIKLNIAGYGEEQKNLEVLVAKLGIQDNVNFLGKISDLEKYELMSKSWVFVYPSTFEGWGISAIEANASGTPVVASDVAGLRDSVNDGVSGMLVEAKNVDQFTSKISEIINNKKLRNSLSRGGIKWASNFDWSNSSHLFIAYIYNYLNASKNYKLSNSDYDLT